MVFSAVPNPSDRSMHDDTAPDSDRIIPSAIFGIGMYNVSLAS